MAAVLPRCMAMALFCKDSSGTEDLKWSPSDDGLLESWKGMAPLPQRLPVIPQPLAQK